MIEQKKLHHLGLIMDGNRRWAKDNGVSIAEGHRQGYLALKNLLSTVKKLDIKILSVYAFSTENWKRSKTEVGGIIKLLKWVLTNELDDLIAENIRVRLLGSRRGLDKDVVKLITHAELKTKNLQAATLAICFNYGGQQEIIEAANKVIENGQEISSTSIENNLYQPDIPPLDLIIRTSGEQRLSNFMMWRASYAELLFTSTLWPDFNGDELKKMVEQYYSIIRRFGV